MSASTIRWRDAQIRNIQAHEEQRPFLGLNSVWTHATVENEHETEDKSDSSQGFSGDEAEMQELFFDPQTGPPQMLRSDMQPVGFEAPVESWGHNAGIASMLYVPTSTMSITAPLPVESLEPKTAVGKHNVSGKVIPSGFPPWIYHDQQLLGTHSTYGGDYNPRLAYRKKGTEETPEPPSERQIQANAWFEEHASSSHAGKAGRREAHTTPPPEQQARANTWFEERAAPQPVRRARATCTAT